MSQSPVNDFSDGGSLRYKQGWRALNRLLHEDRSFSGRERHCAFLNIGGATASFATGSAVTGFDFPDDGRGLATADWDFDGDLDVWLTNRTAPRVRFLKNHTAAKPYVAFKLRGDGLTSSRDAIGARLELHLRGAGKHPVRIRTLRGGEGFLSQSSNWIHFGLGEAAGIDKLVVRWPGGPSQEISGLEPGRFYRVTQGRDTAERFNPPEGRLPLDPAPQVVGATRESARIVVPPGLPLPSLSTLAADGREQPWEPVAGRPTVINLWATWCAPCLAELAAWTADRDAFTAAGLEVVAFNTDGLGGTPGATPAEAAARLQTLGFPFAGVRASEQSLHALDHLQRAVLDRWKSLPLPSSFLVDGQGELVAIYKGPVEARQVIADVKLATANQRRAAATPFPGVWLDEQAGRTDPKRLANIMLDHDEADAAIRYLDRCAKLLANRKDLPGNAQQLGDIHYMAGLLKPGSPAHRAGAIDSLVAARDLIPSDLRIRKALAQQFFAASRGGEAAAELLAATRINPADLSLRSELADLHHRLGDDAKAKAVFDDLLAADPKNALARYYRAGVMIKLGDPRAAIQDYRQTLTDSPRLLDAANDLARILAGHPDAAVRSPDEALALAQRLSAITKEKDAGFLDTLALAFANKGEYKPAIEAANKAVALVPPGDEATLKAMRARIQLYEAGQPARR